jgi:hypothetical protein
MKMEKFAGYNNIPEDGEELGNGLCVAPSEIAAIEGFVDKHGQLYSVIHLRSGAKFRVIGSPDYILQYAVQAAATIN